MSVDHSPSELKLFLKKQNLISCVNLSGTEHIDYTAVSMIDGERTGCSRKPIIVVEMFNDR